MPFAQWDQSLSVHVSEIDEQHRRLIDMINDLHEAVGNGRGKVVVEQVVRRFNRYTLEHFAAEEKLMDRYAYPGYADHMEQHLACAFRALDFFKGCIQGRPDLAREVLDYLVDWFMTHIRVTDRKLGLFLQSKGLS